MNAIILKESTMGCFRWIHQACLPCYRWECWALSGQIWALWWLCPNFRIWLCWQCVSRSMEHLWPIWLFCRILLCCKALGWKSTFCRPNRYLIWHRGLFRWKDWFLQWWTFCSKRWNFQPTIPSLLWKGCYWRIICWEWYDQHLFCYRRTNDHRKWLRRQRYKIGCIFC